MFGFEGTNNVFSGMAQWLSWLERRPVTAKVVGSSPIWVVKGLFNPCGVLAQLGEHLPYKQRVIGSSPIGSICRSGGTGRRPGLKIPWVVIPVPVRFRSAAFFAICIYRKTTEKPCKIKVFSRFLFFCAGTERQKFVKKYTANILDVKILYV